MEFWRIGPTKWKDILTPKVYVKTPMALLTNDNKLEELTPTSTKADANDKLSKFKEEFKDLRVETDNRLKDIVKAMDRKTLLL